MGPIELTPEERKLWEGINFPPSSGHEMRQASIEPAFQLARSLLERKAIPPVRWRYFTDPDLNIGQGKSRKEVFESNGVKGDAILRHPHFHKHLRYFVRGPGLPSEAIDEFAMQADECRPVTSGDMDTFCNLARRRVRMADLDRRVAAEEYFKLGLELEIGEDVARAVRESVMRA